MSIKIIYKKFLTAGGMKVRLPLSKLRPFLRHETPFRPVKQWAGEVVHSCGFCFACDLNVRMSFFRGRLAT